MNKDLKNILLYCIIGFIFVFAALSIRGCGRDLDSLEKQNQALENTRDSLKTANDRLKSKFESFQKSIDLRNIRINDLVAKTDSANRVAFAYKKIADKISIDLAATNKKIEDLKNNPIKRNDEDLIKSLKNKLKDK